MAERRIAAGIFLSEDRPGAYAVKINICRPGTVAAACTLTDAAVAVGGVSRAALNRDTQTGGEVTRP
jgi:hypothetical protein